MNKIEIKTEVGKVTINNLGTNLNKEFVSLYVSFYKNGLANIDNPEFKDASMDFFSRIKDIKNNEERILCDCYFENFTIITTNLEKRFQYNVAFSLWEKIIEFVKGWEELSGSKLHKGTLYYFAAVSSVLANDFDTAFICMGLAQKEDKDNGPGHEKTPSYYFLTLNEEESSYLKKYVKHMINFVRDRLDGNGNEMRKYKNHYQGARGGSLTYRDFRLKFLDDSNISDEIRDYFAYSVIRLWHLRKLHKNKIGNDNIIAPVIFSQALGGIFITIEKFLQRSLGNTGTLGKLIKELSKNKGWDHNLNLGQINEGRDNNFGDWIDACLAEKSLFGDFKLVYGLRNFTFHNIESQQKLWREYMGILQSTCNCLFKSIEEI